MRTIFRVALVPVLLVITVLVLSAPSPASAAWQLSGSPVCDSPAAQAHPAVATDGAGGAIIAWEDLRTPPSKIAAQHILASGDRDTASWPFYGRAMVTDPLALADAPGGQAAPVIVPDGAGGVVVAWQDGRSSVTGTDIFAQHVLATGRVDAAWPANGTALSEIEGLQDAPAMVSDDAGGAFVTWMDRRPGASQVDIYAQHVLASGLVDARVPAIGIAVSTAPGPQELPAIIRDGVGDAIIAWQDRRSATSGLDIYAQHVLSSGVLDPTWPLNGRVLCTAVGDQGHPTITSDGAHGAIVAWTDSRLVGVSHIFAQHVLGSGAVDPAWPANGRAISGAAGLESRPLAIPDGTGGAIVTWQGLNAHLNMYARQVTSTGTVDPAWAAGGGALSVSDRDQSHAAIASDGAGGALVAWQENDDIIAQHVLASGVLYPAFPDSGRALCELPSQQAGPALVTAGEGGAIVAWADGRRGVDVDIFALEVLAADPVSLCLSSPDPLPAEVDGNLRVSQNGSDALIAWSVADGATASSVLRGQVRGLPVGSGGEDEQCLEDNTAVSALTDSDLPALGDSFWYLIRGENVCGSGSYGFEALQGASSARRESATCP